MELKQLNIINSNSTLVYLIEVNKTKLLSLRDKEEWSAYLNKLPESMQDVYYTPEYYEIYEKNGDGKAFCFVFEEGNHLALYPFLLNRINDIGYDLDESYYDIQGAYGYNGVVYSSEDPDFIKNFYNEFNKFCKDNNIVAEFTRFHPLLENHQFSKDYLDVSYNRQVVYVDLTKGYDEIYKKFHSSVRKNINTAKKNNLKTSVYQNDFPYKKEFVQFYKETMSRVNADRYLYFSEDYFENLFKNLPIVQFVVFKDEEPIASSLCLQYGVNFNHHLLGARSDYLKYRPNDFLYDNVIKYGLQRGFKQLLLGGGRTTSKDDSLFRFKENFSKLSGNFRVGKGIYNQEIYNNICKKWSAKFPLLIDKYEDKLFKYRFLS